MRRKRSPDEAMTLVEHLEELRYRLIVCLAALLPALVAGWYLAPRLLTHLRRPAEAYGAQLTQLAPGEVLWVYLKLTLIAGIVLASPVLLYQLGAFVWPGLTRRERRLAAVLLPGTVALFVAGGAFAYLVLLPLVLRFLVGLRPEGIASSLSVQSYVNFVVGLVVPVALVFEFPAAVALLTVMGLVTPAFLRHLRKYAILVIFIVAAAITPPDPFSQLIVAVPMLALYEVAVLLSAAVHHFQRRGVW